MLDFCPGFIIRTHGASVHKSQILVTIPSLLHRKPLFSMCERCCKPSAPNASVDIMAPLSDAAGCEFGDPGVEARLPAPEQGGLSLNW